MNITVWMSSSQRRKILKLYLDIETTQFGVVGKFVDGLWYLIIDAIDLIIGEGIKSNFLAICS
jgi:hypothetical protein